MNIKKRTVETVGLIICAVIYVALVIRIIFVNRLGVDYLSLFGLEIGVGNLSGIFTSLQMLMCIIMVCINYRNGTTLASILMTISLINTTSSILINHSMAALPGITTLIISFIAVLVIHHQLMLREKEAITDYLTGLNNRLGLFMHLSNRVRKSTPFSLIYIDLDSFKFINDSMSHKVGDDVLCQISDRISSVVGKHGIVGRMGGDEFIVILSGNIAPEIISKEIISSVCQEIKVNDNNEITSCYVTASIGIASFPTDTRDADELVKLADIAMYQAKKSGKNKFVRYNSEITDQSVRQAYLETVIKQALDKDSFYLVFQPQYNSSTKQLRGFETLLRLKDARGDNISPAEFIPAAEKTDLILEVDDYVLRKSMNTFSDVVKSASAPLIISINVSAKNIGNQKFPDKVKAILEETGFPASSLEIEITEYCLVQSLDTAAENLKKLKEMGMKIALDDFGTGYASLSNLSGLPVDLLKIDKSFIDNIESDTVSNDFINAVISMGHILGCEVISEGVETEAQIDLLHKQNCDYIQGYVWGKPMEYNDALKLI